MKGLKGAVALIAAAGLSLSITNISAAQDMEPVKIENVDWMTMTMVDFKPGMRDRAMEIIDKHFAPAGEKAGTPAPWAMHFQTGSWDAVYFWEMEGGPGDMVWWVSANDVKWRKAFNEQEGGADKAMALIKEYQNAIARTDMMIGHHHRPDKKMD